MDVEFVADVFAVRQDGVDADKEFVGYLLVLQASDNQRHDLALACGEHAVVGILYRCLHRFVCFIADFLFKFLDSGYKKRVLDLAVTPEIELADEDVIHHRVEEVGGRVRLVVFYDDVLKLLKLAVDRLVGAREILDLEARALVAFEKLVDIGEYLSVLMLHVDAHLIGVVVVEFHDQADDLVDLAHVAADYSLKKLAADGRELEVEKILVGFL